MLDFTSLNWLAVIACVVVSMISGAIWYNPKTFFPAWWKAIGKDENEKPGGENMGIVWGMTVLGSLVQAIFVGLFVNALGNANSGATLISGALTGLFLAIGIVAPTALVNKMFAGHGFKVWLIEVGNHVVNFVLFGAIFGAWR